GNFERRGLARSSRGAPGGLCGAPEARILGAAVAGKTRSDEPTQSERPPPLARKKSSAPPEGRQTPQGKGRQETAGRPTVPDKRPRRPPSSPPPHPPTLYADRYELAGLLGVGAMGSVYRAEDVLLGETIALKVLRKDLGHSQLAVTRFHREAK